VAEKPEDKGPPIDVAYLSIIVAVAICVVIVAGYIFALRCKPQVDADLYSSIYGADFEDEAMGGDIPVTAEPEAPTMTPEEQALYGDDYDTEGEYEDDDGEYEDAEGEYDQEYYEGDDVAFFPPTISG